MPAGSREALVVFAVALAVRVAFVVAVYPRVEAEFQTPDGYDAIAASLAAGRGFELEGSSVAAAERLPLYPALLALSLAAFGPSPFPWQLAQCVLGAVACAVVALVAFGCAGRAGALAAGLACALHPTLVLYVARPLTETLYVLLLVLSLRAMTAGWWLAAGLWLGLDLLVKSSAFLNLVAAAPYARRARPRALAAGAAAAALVVLPWVGWNLHRHGAPHLLTATAGRNLHQGLFISRRVGWTTPVGELNREADWALWNDVRRRRIPWTGDVRRDDATAGRLAREWIAAHPATAARLWARNLVLTWYLGRSGASMAVHAVEHAVLLALAAVGAAALWRVPATRPFATALVLLVGAYTVAHAVIKPGVRYVLPAVPPAAILAGAGVAALLRRPAPGR
jgi:4-amino-4-deoxy-L-arabinose transferase-like glycosyltransferase